MGEPTVGSELWENLQRRNSMDEEERKQWRILFGGTIMTQVAICRFLISKGLTERSELVSWIDAKRQLWEASAGPAGGGAGSMFVCRVFSELEPEVSKTNDFDQG